MLQQPSNFTLHLVPHPHERDKEEEMFDLLRNLVSMSVSIET